MARLRPGRYVDTFLQETKPSFQDDVPLSRTHLPNATYKYSGLPVSAPRLLTDPIRTAELLQVQLRLPHGALPFEAATDAVDFSLDIVSVLPENEKHDNLAASVTRLLY